MRVIYVCVRAFGVHTGSPAFGRRVRGRVRGESSIGGEGGERADLRSKQVPIRPRAASYEYTADD